MYDNNFFSLKRLGCLIRCDLVNHKQSMFVFGITLMAILFLFGLIFLSGDGFHIGAYYVVLFLGGFWVTSRAFRAFHDRRCNYTLLTLPCSNFEKLLAKLLLTSVGYVILISACFFVASVVIYLLAIALFHTQTAIFNPFEGKVLLEIASYLLLQSIFLLGSIYFKTHQFSKTILAAVCLVIIFRVIFIAIDFSFAGISSVYGMLSLMPNTSLLETVLYLLMAPACWMVSYLRLKELEV